MWVYMYRGVAVALLFVALIFSVAVGAYVEEKKQTGKDTAKATNISFTLWFVITLLAVLLFCSPGAHAGETVRYHRLGDRVYGSDGSVTHQFGDRVYQRWPDGRQTVCHQFGNATTCTSER